MAAVAPPQVVPGALRAPLPFGLFSVLGFRPEGARWENGVIFEALSCEPAGGIGEPDCEPNVPAVATVFGVVISGTAPTSGAFQITDGTLTSTPIAFNATAAQVATALDAFGVTATGGPLPGSAVVVTYSVAGETPALSVTGSTLDSGTASVTVATEGSDAVINTIGLPKDLESGGGPLGEASPFTVYGHHVCSPIGQTGAAAQALADQHLVAREEARAEQALWTGDLGNVPNFSGANGYDAPVSLGPADDAAEALALVEQGIAGQYGSLGVIHMNRYTASLLKNHLEARGGRLFTRLGTPVVAGAGYPNVPQIIGSPAVFGYRSDVFTSSNRPYDLLDRSNNNHFAVAERTYLLAVDPCPIVSATYTTAP